MSSSRTSSVSCFKIWPLSLVTSQSWNDPSWDKKGMDSNSKVLDQFEMMNISESEKLIGFVGNQIRDPGEHVNEIGDLDWQAIETGEALRSLNRFFFSFGAVKVKTSDFTFLALDFLRDHLRCRRCFIWDAEMQEFDVSLGTPTFHVKKCWKFQTASFGIASLRGVAKQFSQDSGLSRWRLPVGNVDQNTRFFCMNKIQCKVRVPLSQKWCPAGHQEIYGKNKQLVPQRWFP